MNRDGFVRSTGVISVFVFLVVGVPSAYARANGADSSDPALRSYLAGNGLLNRGLYDLAATEYRRFLSDHSDHDRAPLAQYGLGVCLFRTKQYAGAIEQLTPVAALSDFEFATEVATMLGQSHLAMKQYEPAAQFFQAGARKHPGHALADEAAMGAAESLYMLSRYGDAAEWAKLFSSKWPESPNRPRAAFFGGLAEMARKGFEEAGKLFASVLELDPDGPFADQSCLFLAQCYDQSQSGQAAIRQYQALLQRKKTKYAPEALYGLGVLHRQRGERKEAALVLDTLLGRFGQSKIIPRAALLRGRVAFEQDAFEAAAGFFQKAGQADAGLRDRTEYWRAKCDLRLEHFEKADARLTKAVESFPKSELLAEMWYDLSIARLRMESFDGAIEALNTFRKRFPDHDLAAEALRLLAMTEHQRRGFEESLRYARLFLATYPSHGAAADLMFLVGENDFLSGRYEQAVDDYRQYLSKYQQDAQSAKAKLRLGTALHRLGRLDEAEPYLAEVSGHTDDAAVFGSSHLALGDIHFRRGEWKQAEKELRAFLQAGTDQPGADDALIKLGLSLQRQERPEEAVSVYDVLLGFDFSSPHRLQALFEKGQALVMLDRRDEAETAFREVLAEGEESRFAPHALNHLAALAMHRGAFDEANTLYAKAAGSPADDELRSGAAYQRIKALMASKRFADAETAITAYLSNYSATGAAPAARAQLAIALSRQDKYDQAVVAADHAVVSAAGLEPSLLAAVQYEKAWCLRELGRTDEAAKAYAQLIEQGLTREYELHALLELAGIESGAKRFKRAAGLLRRIRESGDADAVPADVMAQATYRLGVCEFELGRFAEAVSLFETYLAGAGGDRLTASAAFYAGESAFKLGQFERSVKHLARVTKDFATDDVAAPSLLRLGESYAKLQQFGQSERVFKAYLDAHADNEQWYQARFGLGWAQENQQRHDAAIRTYRQVIARHQGPTSARAQFQIGECLFAQQKYAAAAAELLKVDILYDYPQWSAAALFEAGRCFVKLNKVAEARKQFEQASKVDQKSRWAEMAQAQLEALATASVPGS